MTYIYIYVVRRRSVKLSSFVFIFNQSDYRYLFYYNFTILKQGVLNSLPVDLIYAASVYIFNIPPPKITTLW